MAQAAPSLVLAFAYNDPHYSDRVLHLVSEEQKPKKTNTRKRKARTIEDVEPEADVAEEDKIHVASVILSGSSDVFKAMLGPGPMRESREKTVRLFVEPSMKPAMKAFINYMYTGTLPQDALTLIRVAVLADQYHVPGALTSAGDAMLHVTMDDKDCSESMKLLGPYDGREEFSPFYKAITRLLILRFPDLDKEVEAGKRSALFALSLKELSLLLQSSELKVECENTVFQLVKKWCDVQKAWTDGIKVLLPLIRFPHMDTAFLHSISFSRFAQKLEDAATLRELSHLVTAALNYKEHDHHKLSKEPSFKLQMTPRQYVSKEMSERTYSFPFKAATASAQYSPDFHVRGWCMALKLRFEEGRVMPAILLRTSSDSPLHVACAALVSCTFSLVHGTGKAFLLSFIRTFVVPGWLHCRGIPVAEWQSLCDKYYPTGEGVMVEAEVTVHAG